MWERAHQSRQRKASEPGDGQRTVEILLRAAAEAV